MIKCTDALFVETSPSTFYRKNKYISKMNDDEHEITDFQIKEKLQLILISMRQQSEKASGFFEYEKERMQTEINEQSKLINLLEEENNLLRSYVEAYVEKFGEISLQTQQVKIVESKIYQNKLSKTADNGFLKVDNISVKRSSNMSTNYISNFSKSTNDFKQPGVPKQEQRRNRFSSSTGSNFYRKNSHYEQNLYQVKQAQIRILPLVTKNKLHEISQISNIQSAQQTLIHQFNQSHILSEELSQYEDQIQGLGLESKGSDFFNMKQSMKQNIAENKVDQTLLIQSSELLIQSDSEFYHRQNQNQIIEEPEQDTYQESETENPFQSLKTDSDIRRMNEILAQKFPIKEPITEECAVSGQVKLTISDIDKSQLRQPTKNIKELNSSYFKTLDVFSKRSHTNDSILEDKERKKSIKTAEKKLKQLFEPLPSNILGKKIKIPKNSERKQFYPRQSQNIVKLSQIFAPFENKIKLGSSQNQNILHLMNKSINLKKKML